MHNIGDEMNLVEYSIVNHSFRFDSSLELADVHVRKKKIDARSAAIYHLIYNNRKERIMRTRTRGSLTFAVLCNYFTSSRVAMDWKTKGLWV